MELNDKQKKIVALAQAGGNDAQLLLLEEIQKLEEKVKALADSAPSFNNPFLTKVLAETKGEKGDKGDKGDRGEKGDSIQGERGEKGEPGRDGINGKDGERGDMGLRGNPGEPGTPGKDGSPDTPEQVRDKLETLKGDERLDKSAIKGLDEAIKEIPRIETRSIFGGGKTKVLTLDITSLLDGSTKTFPVGTHFGITGVWSSSSPYIFRPVIDYNEVGKNIVFTSAVDASISLAAGQQVIIQYLK